MSKTMKDFVSEAKESIQEVDAATAAADSNSLLLDVREADELESDGKAKGALHVPRGLLEAKADTSGSMTDERLAEAKEQGETVYAYCASGARSSLATKTLTEMGYRAVNIEGGFGAWKKEGLPLED